MLHYYLVSSAFEESAIFSFSGSCAMWIYLQLHFCGHVYQNLQIHQFLHLEMKAQL